MSLRFATALCSVAGILVLGGLGFVLMNRQLAAPPLVQMGHIYIHFEPMSNAPLDVQQAGGARLAPRPVAATLPVVQSWTRALTDYYHGDSGATVTDARAALNKLQGRTNETRFMRAQIALLAVKASRDEGNRTMQVQFAHQARADAEGMLSDVTASTGDKRAARQILADVQDAGAPQP
jgi:hypothetical protein